MKVDMNKLMGTDMEEMRPSPHRGITKSIVMRVGCGALCLMLAGSIMIEQSVLNKDDVSADELYDESLANPSFTVQHFADVAKIDIQSGEGDVTVLTNDDGQYYTELDDNGMFNTITERVELYDEYQTNWEDINSITGASFLNDAEGFSLSEVWFGQDKESKNQSDFLVLRIPMTDGKADLSKVVLTNNPEHPGLSTTTGGYYIPDSDGNYIVCIQDSDVVRLVFKSEESWASGNVDVFDYDVSDGGYYLEDDYFHKNDIHETSGQANETGTIYVDAVENGIHSEKNYSGRGAKLAFGGADIGTELSDEFLDDGLNTLNIWNYGQQEQTSGTGVAKGLVSGVDLDGDIKWSMGVSAPRLFSNVPAEGKTDYQGKYSLVFKKNGFGRMLSAVESEYGTAAENLEMMSDKGGVITNSFWITDVAPSYGTDGHDPIWGDGSENIVYYRTKDRAPEPFMASLDGQNHNSFFGMSYTEDFVLQPGYTGPLDFFGYSDDDMWVFAGQVDDNGNVLTDTVIQAADLGGVHDGAGYYCNLWDVIDQVSYGEDAQKWRLFVFWLERDGKTASCFLNFTLSENVDNITDRDTGSVVIEAGKSGVDESVNRTFLFDDGTYDRYTGIYDDEKKVTIVSGTEFTIPDGSFIEITGLNKDSEFKISETNAAHVWSSTGDNYEETNVRNGTVGTDEWLTFISAADAGRIAITVDADNTPEGEYGMKLVIDGAESTEISAMDGSGNPIGSQFTDKNGVLNFTLAAGETLMLYNLPDGAEFTLTPDEVPGFRISEILLNNANASGMAVTGRCPAYVAYRYKENTKQPVQVLLEQSVDDDWDTSDIMLGSGALVSYRISVTNPNDTAIDISVEDKIPDGISVMQDSLSDGGSVNGNVLKWNQKLDADSTAELLFTCQVMGEETQEICNSVQVVMNEEEPVDSNTVIVIIP